MMSSALEPVLWILGLLLFYAGIGGGIVVLLIARRSGQPALFAAAIASVVFAFGALLILPRTGLFGFLGAGALALAMVAGFYQFGLRRAIDWQLRKYGRETARQTCLH